MNWIIEPANLFLALSAGFGAAWSGYWLWKDNITDGATKFVRAWFLIMISIFINAGWFWLSRHTSPEGMIWNPWMFQHRWILLLTTALAFGAGVAQFVSAIEPQYKKSIWAGYGVLLFFCLIMEAP